MGIKYRIKKLFRKETTKFVEISRLKESIKLIASSGNKIIAICLDNTGNSYLGVKNATLNLFPQNTLILPAYYSNINLNDKQFREMAEVISSCEFEQVIFSSLPIQMNNLLNRLQIDKIQIKVIFHGALSELSNEENETQFFNMVEYAKEGKIKKIGFVKSGLELWAGNLFNISTSKLQLKPLFLIDFSKEKLNPKNNKIKIGVFGNNSFNKNSYNQIAGALLIDNVEIHTLIHTKFSEFGFKDKIHTHKLMNHNDFVHLIAQMDINLHISFSEGMGGQVFTESLSQGVPCLTSFNNDYLIHDVELLKLLTVDQYENPWQIKKGIERVLNYNPVILKKRLVNYSSIITKEADLLLESFLNNSSKN